MNEKKYKNTSLLHELTEKFAQAGFEFKIIMSYVKYSISPDVEQTFFSILFFGHVFILSSTHWNSKRNKTNMGNVLATYTRTQNRMYYFQSCSFTAKKIKFFLL